MPEAGAGRPAPVSVAIDPPPGARSLRRLSLRFGPACRARVLRVRLRVVLQFSRCTVAPSHFRCFFGRGRCLCRLVAFPPPRIPRVLVPRLLCRFRLFAWASVGYASECGVRAAWCLGAVFPCHCARRRINFQTHSSRSARGDEMAKHTLAGTLHICLRCVLGEVAVLLHVLFVSRFLPDK